MNTGKKEVFKILHNKEKNYKIVPLSYDLTFKYLFGSNKNIKYTKSLLKALGYSESLLDGMIIQNSIVLSKEIIKEKKFELDVLVKLRSGNYINLEMQRLYDDAAERKSILYVMKQLVRILKMGESYNSLKNVTQYVFTLNNTVHKNIDKMNEYKISNINNLKDTY